MNLWSINRLLRTFGLVLVVATGDSQETRIWIERARAYDARCRAQRG